MSWLDKIAKKRLEELEAHPELNSDKFAEKMSTLYFAIVLLLLLYLFFCFGTILNILKFGSFHKDKKIATIVAIIA